MKQNSSPAKKRKKMVVATADNVNEVANGVRAEKTSVNTKSNYAGKMVTMATWLEEHYPGCVNENMDVIPPVPKSAVLGFFGHLCGPAHERKKLNDATQIQEGEADPYSASHVRGFRSALVDVYERHHMRLEESLDIELKTLLDGYDKMLNNLRQRGLMKIGEGKKKLLLTGYHLLAKKFMTLEPRKSGGNWQASSFMWSYFVLMWNMMSRTDSVDSLMLQHIQWEEDALVIEEQGHKGDQKGEDKYGKHIFANPLMPWVCPVLALAVYIFSYPWRTGVGTQQLFTGTKSKDRFSHNLRAILSGLSDEEEVILGCDWRDIGTHSCRKGGCTYCLGQVQGPSPVTVYIRMGHSLGKLKDRYVFAGDGADQLCGRMLCGLDYNSENFAILPPHFPHDITALFTDDYWNGIVTGYNNYPDSFKTTFPFLLASVVYHEDYLRTNLDADHPIFSARVFTQNAILEKLRGNVLLGTARCEQTGMIASGIPPHLAAAAKIENLHSKVEALLKSNDDLRQQLPQVLATEVMAKIMSQLEINGAVAVTPEVLEERLKTMGESIVHTLQQKMTTMEVELTRQHTSGMGSHGSDTIEQSWWKSFYWQDGLICHTVPRGWTFPTRKSLRTLWDLWYFGDMTEGIRPYRLISAKFDLNDKDRKGPHLRARKIMRYLDDLTRGEDYMLPPGKSSVAELTCFENEELFARVLDVAIGQLYKGEGKECKNKGALCYGTLYNALCMKKRRRSVD